MAKTQTVRLVALGRDRYGTRRLQAGEEYDARRQDADLLVRIGKARYAGSGPQPSPKPPPSPTPPPPPIQEPEPEEEDDDRDAEPRRSGGDDVEPLRAEARDLGIAVDGRWGPARLRAEINRQKCG